MAKRFTETNKWNDVWFSSLTPTQKFVFLYLIDVCDNAGFYELNYRRMEFDLGIDEEKIKGALKGLERGLEVANEILFIKNFLRHQNNLPLSENNPAHKQIIKLVKFQLERVSDDLADKKFKGALEGLLSPLMYSKGIVKEEDIDSTDNVYKKEPFEKFWNLYDKKVGEQKKLKKKWEELSHKNQKDILEFIPKYKIAQPDKKFRKDPDTFFNNQSWKDELISEGTNNTGKNTYHSPLGGTLHLTEEEYNNHPNKLMFKLVKNA